MASVYVSNLIINSGTDFTQTFTLESPETNSAFNLTGFTVTSQIRKWSGSSTAIEFSCGIYNPPSLGKLFLSLTNEQTNNLKPGRYLYDVIITDGTNKKTKVIEGMVLVREGVTK